MVDAKNKNGHTVLHAALLAGWAAGVCICLEAGASITVKVLFFMSVIDS